MINIVERNHLEDLHIKELYDALLKEMSRINNLKDKFGTHPLTKKLGELRRMRRLYISSIKFRLKVAVRENNNKESTDLRTVKDSIDHFLHNLTLSRN